MKPGTRLKSAVCETEVMVIKVADYAICCGGVPMVEERPSSLGAIDPAFAEGTKLGKRYVDSGGALELLCVKPGKGSLSIDGVALRTRDAKPLPSSD